MDDLGSILGNRNFAEPPEVALIKNFVREHYNTAVQVTVQPQHIVVNVKSAALAGALRPHLHELQQLCDTDRRLLIRIQ